MRVVWFIIGLIILLLGISFAVLNAAAVNFHYYFGDANIPLSLLLTFTLIIGVALGLLISLCWLFHGRAERARLRRELAVARKQLAGKISIKAEA